VDSVLRQTFSDFELIVVDDGGQDDTEQVLFSYKDDRIRYVRRENGGISAARNTGLSKAGGQWVTFLDDDDEVFPDWLSAFDDLLIDPKVGIACVGIVQKSKMGTRVVLPRILRPIYENAFGLFMAGSFASRTVLLREVGGFAEGLLCSHATELALRLIPACHRHGWRVQSISQPMMQINRETHWNRPMSSPKCLLSGVTYILQRHEHLLKKNPDAIARYLSIAGVASARLGMYSDCRKFLLQAVRAYPWNIRTYIRLAVSMNRQLADRIWKYADPGQLN
jgi:glycosyltransferase involved in cell wall biosynthesis